MSPGPKIILLPFEGRSNLLVDGREPQKTSEFGDVSLTEPEFNFLRDADLWNPHAW